MFKRCPICNGYMDFSMEYKYGQTIIRYTCSICSRNKVKQWKGKLNV